MNGIDPYAYLNEVSVKMDKLTQRDQIETVLDEVVRKRAGSNLNRLWVTWDPEHTSVEMSCRRKISSNQFPVYGIREDWLEKDVDALVQEYIGWTAPSLLTIPYLDNSSRARLESGLEKQACSIEYHWRLYPEILDEKKVTAARVQARLQTSERVVR